MEHLLYGITTIHISTLETIPRRRKISQQQKILDEKDDENLEDEITKFLSLKKDKISSELTARADKTPIIIDGLNVAIRYGGVTFKVEGILR